MRKKKKHKMNDDASHTEDQQIRRERDLGKSYIIIHRRSLSTKPGASCRQRLPVSGLAHHGADFRWLETAKYHAGAGDGRK